MPPGGNSQIAAFTARALVATFTGVSGFAVLAGPLLLATLAVVVWRPAGRLQAAFIALATTTVLMFAGIGVQRVGLGLQLAESSRYVYMGAMLLAPMIAVAIDRIAVISSSGLLAARLLLRRLRVPQHRQPAELRQRLGEAFGVRPRRAGAAGRRAGPHRADPAASTSCWRSASTCAWRTCRTSSPRTPSRRGPDDGCRRSARPGGTEPTVEGLPVSGVSSPPLTSASYPRIMPEFEFTELLPIGHDDTPYRLVTTEGVDTVDTPLGRFVRIEPSLRSRC